MLSEMSGSIEKGVSSTHKELKSKLDPLESENSKWDPLESEKPFVSVDIQIVEKNITIFLKSATKYASYWCNVSSNNTNGLSKLLGIEYKLCINIMHKLNLFTNKNKKLFPKQNLLEKWLAKHSITGTMQQCRK